jgi:hypothetical protein
MKIASLILSFFVLSAPVWGPAVRPASSDSGAATFQYLAGSSFLCGFFSGACPDVARADNGDTIEISGLGILTIHPKSVGGGGTFIHKDSSGNVLSSGTWTAQELISFVPYLVLPPDNIAGGQALIRVHLSTGFDAILDIDCEIGAPAGQTEGVTLNIQDVINFNKKVSGITLYIKQ